MKKIFVYLTLGLTTFTSYAATPLWMHDIQISPDSTEIAFCYKGDIYKIPAKGGAATQLTTQDSYESNPIQSPNGRQIAFTSDRYGNFNVFIMSADGGAAQRLTTNSTGETPSALTPDGKYILFSAAIQDPVGSASFPRSAMTELYKAPVTGGRTEQILDTPVGTICFDKSGNLFSYQDQKGFEDQWRKHHTSSITHDIWTYDTRTGKHSNLTRHAGEDRDPILAPDGQTLYFLSECNGGSFNVYAFPLVQPESVKVVTDFKTHPIRLLSTSNNGALCYGYDGEIYTQQGGSAPRKVQIEITRDDPSQVEHLNYTNGATSAVVSPDGKQIGFIIRDEIFVTPTDYATTKQVTRIPVNESGLSFAPDNRTLAYASERNGNWQLYLAKIARKEDPDFPNATIIKEEVLLPSTIVERACPQFSPDGKELAFIEGRIRLMVLNLETKKVRQITDGSTWYSTDGEFSYAWSSDSKWFTLEFIGNEHDPYSDIRLVSVQGNSPIINLTDSGYISGSPRFAFDGNAILFKTERYDMRAHASWGSQDDAMLIFLNQDTYDKYCLSKEGYELRKELEAEQKKAQGKDAGKDKKKSQKDTGKDKADDDSPQVKDIIVELKNLENRIVRLTPNSSDMGSVIISRDGEILYYLAAFEDGYDLWKVDLRKKEAWLLHKMDAGWASMEMDKSGKNPFLLDGKAIQKMDVASNELKPVNYQAQIKMDLAAECEYMFDHIYKQQQEHFYNTNMYNVDWDSMSAAYHKFLPYINNNYDFAELLSEWLGELNVSYTGGRYYPTGQSEPIASLRLLFDWNYRGKGMCIAEVLEKSSFDNADTKAATGIVIEKIDGTEITPEVDYYTLLNDRAKKKTLVSLYNPQARERWEEVVTSISNSMLSTLLYIRWMKQCAADVDKWSSGRLGYVHIKSTGDDSLRSVYSDILGKYNNYEGVIIDTRFNGGGRLYEDIEILFSGKKYFTQVIRGREACDMPSRRQSKPFIMLTCEANYSNAYSTPWVYRHRNIGKLVSMPVPGTMTSVSWERLQDPSLVFGIPVVGYRLPGNSYLENSQLEPDIKVADSPETIVKGKDTQLKVAVEEPLKELESVS